MKHILRVLRFLRLIDEQNNLSLTNIAVMVVIVKLALLHNYGLEDLGVLLIALLNYAAKRVIEKKKKETMPEDANPLVEKMQDDIKELKDKVSSVAIATGIMRKQ